MMKLVDKDTDIEEAFFGPEAFYKYFSFNNIIPDGEMDIMTSKINDIFRALEKTLLQEVGTNDLLRNEVYYRMLQAINKENLELMNIIKEQKKEIKRLKEKDLLFE